MRTSNTSTRPRLARTIGEEIADTTRGLMYAQAEGFAAAGDAASDFWESLLEGNDDMCESGADAGRPRRTMRSSYPGYSMMRSVAQIQGRMMDRFYEEYYRRRQPETTGTAATAESLHRAPSPSGHSVIPEREMVSAARDYLHRVPGHAVTERALIDHVMLSTSYGEAPVRSAIHRHFVTSGKLVCDTVSPSPGKRRSDVEIRMRERLKDLGYTDLRYDVVLGAFDNLGERASIVAFEADMPIVLCYPVDGSVDDPVVREAAQFQALAVNPKSPAHFIWVSDGQSDYYCDVKKDAAISSLPRAAGGAGSTTEKSDPKTRSDK